MIMHIYEVVEEHVSTASSLRCSNRICNRGASYKVETSHNRPAGISAAALSKHCPSYTG